MSILGWIILGGIAGWIASLLMREESGCLFNIFIGIVGAILGGFVFTFISGSPGVTGFNLWSLFVAVIGSIILLAIARVLRGRTY